MATASDSDSNALTDIFNRPKFARLPEQLQRMAKTIPDENASNQDWKNWANELQALWLDALGLSKEELTFTLEEAEALKDYL